MNLIPSSDSWFQIPGKHSDGQPKKLDLCLPSEGPLLSFWLPASAVGLAQLWLWQAFGEKASRWESSVSLSAKERKHHLGMSPWRARNEAREDSLCWSWLASAQQSPGSAHRCSSKAVTGATQRRGWGVLGVGWRIRREIGIKWHIHRGYQ